MIPKIIHHVYISDRKIKSSDQWSWIWQKCYSSWKEQFSENEYEYFFWDDDTSENFIKEKYPEYFEFYLNIPFRIMKADIIRLFALHYYGGIYSDMDVYCYKNFYHLIDKDFKIAEHKFGLPGEFLQNSLMASKEKNDFFLNCVDRAIHVTRSDFYNSFDLQNEHNLDQYKMTELVLNFCGPLAIQDVFSHMKYDQSNLFPYKQFNNQKWYYDDSLYTRHIGTVIWDTKIREHGQNFDKIFQEDVNIDFQTFDFYKNYYVT